MKPTQRADEDLSRLERLARKYINSRSKNAETELNEMKIEGRELITLLNNLGIETEEETIKYCDLKVNYEQLVKDYDKLKQDYERLDEDYKGLLNNLELFRKNPIFSSIEGLIKIIKEAEDKIEERRLRF